MPFTPLDSEIYQSTWSDQRLLKIFSDQQHLQFLLKTEAALATTQSKLRIIPETAAQEIIDTIKKFVPDIKDLQEGVLNDGFPIIALLKQLRQKISVESGQYLHYGATTQDIVDTANVLQSQAAINIIDGGLLQLIAKLATLANEHRHTLMAGRTHTQQALPITFGFKVSAWLAPLLRHQQRLQELQPRVFVLQCAGAVGTLASIQNNSDMQTVTNLQTMLAKELNLNAPIMAWHNQRDTWAELAGWLSMLTGSLGKMAADILLMAQTEIGELRESNDSNRGGSSTMPQKSNPIISEQILAAARTNANLLANIHQAIPQEHERGTHGWQMEWLALPQMLGLASGAVENALYLANNLVVNISKMQEHINNSFGLMLAEAFTFALSQHLPRNTAKQLVLEAVQESMTHKKHLREILRSKTKAPILWDEITEKNYLGNSDAVITNVLLAADAVRSYATDVVHSYATDVVHSYATDVVHSYAADEQPNDGRKD